MPRRIQDMTLQSTGPTDSAAPAGGKDQYFDKVVKYVPADVIAAWTAAVAVIKGAAGIPTASVLLLCLIVGIGVTFWWTLKQTNGAGLPPAIRQAAVASVAFLVWILALGDLDQALASFKLGDNVLWNVAYGKLALIGFTLVSGKL